MLVRKDSHQTKTAETLTVSRFIQTVIERYAPHVKIQINCDRNGLCFRWLDSSIGILRRVIGPWLGRWKW